MHENHTAKGRWSACLVAVLLVIAISQMALVKVVRGGCNGGFVTGAYYNTTCTPAGCDPRQLGCTCVNDCNVTLYGEYCSDNTEANSCNSVNFSGMDCGNKGSCSWSGPAPTSSAPTSSIPTSTLPPGQPTNTPVPPANPCSAPNVCILNSASCPNPRSGDCSAGNK